MNQTLKNNDSGALSFSEARRFKLRTLLLVVTANLAGAALLFLYFYFIDTSALPERQFLPWFEITAFLLLPAVAAFVVSWSYSRPVFEYLGAVRKPGAGPLEEDHGGGRTMYLRRRALRFPLVCSLSSSLGWVIMGGMIAARLWLEGRTVGISSVMAQTDVPATSNSLLAEELAVAGESLKMQWHFIIQSLKLVGSGLMLGTVVSAILFFVMENVWQKEMPRFFPREKLSAVYDRWIIPVRYRLLIIFIFVGTVPLLAFGILSYQRTKSMMYLPPEEVLWNLLLFNIFMVLVGGGLAVLLANFVARSVSEPLERLREAMEHVKSGDFSSRVPVRANDEFGRVTEGFNDMVRTLGEKEASLTELTLSLEEKVKERTRALEEALAEKERTQARLIQSEKMASLGQLVAGVAHEINNPVGYIYANTDNLKRFLSRLREQADKDEPEKIKEIINKMESITDTTRDGAKRTKEIVEGLRSFARSGKTSRKTVDIHQPVETAIMLLGHELKHGIKLVRDFSELPPVSANPGELSQVFMNVMMNGIQAMDETGELHISSYREDVMAVVRFQDTGRGIPPSCRDRIFEPFYTTKEVGKGTGLGLAISYGIVQAHNGEIEVENTGDKGTAIVVRIPLAETDKKAGEGES